MNKDFNNFKTKIAVVISIILVLLWMILIYNFSSADGKKSDNTSKSTLENIIRIFNKNIDNIKIQQIVKTYNVYIRKITHYAIYFILGALIYSMYFNINKLLNNKLKFVKLISNLTGIIYAILDEIHQFFVPGRSCQIKDILIDSFGVVTGVIFCFLIYILFYKILELIKKRKNLIK